MITTTRYAVQYTDTGMVLGDGATEAEAWAEAETVAAKGAVTTDGLECVDYDAATHEVRLQGGIVQLNRRRSEVES